MGIETKRMGIEKNLAYLKKMAAPLERVFCLTSHSALLCTCCATEQVLSTANKVMVAFGGFSLTSQGDFAMPASATATQEAHAAAVSAFCLDPFHCEVCRKPVEQISEADAVALIGTRYDTSKREQFRRDFPGYDANAHKVALFAVLVGQQVGGPDAAPIQLGLALFTRHAHCVEDVLQWKFSDDHDMSALSVEKKNFHSYLTRRLREIVPRILRMPVCETSVRPAAIPSSCKLCVAGSVMRCTLCNLPLCKKCGLQHSRAHKGAQAVAHPVAQDRFVGHLVQLEGLRATAALNGQYAVVVGAAPAKGRYKIWLGQKPEGCAIKPENMRIMEQPWLVGCTDLPGGLGRVVQQVYSVLCALCNARDHTVRSSVAAVVLVHALQKLAKRGIYYMTGRIKNAAGDYVDHYWVVCTTHRPEDLDCFRTGTQNANATWYIDVCRQQHHPMGHVVFQLDRLMRRTEALYVGRGPDAACVGLATATIPVQEAWSAEDRATYDRATRWLAAFEEGTSMRYPLLCLLDVTRR